MWGGGVRLDSSGMMGEQRDVLEFQSFPPAANSVRDAAAPQTLSVIQPHIFEKERKSKALLQRMNLVNKATRHISKEQQRNNREL